MKIFTTFLATLVFSLSLSYQCIAESNKSKRIEVYAISQSFWDVEAGDTLSQIAIQILPDNAQRRASLMQEIFKLNRGAFINNDPNQLKANIRLWLPNQGPHSGQVKDSALFHTQTFSWGELYTPRR